MSIVGEGERVVGDLYNSDYKFAIAGIRFIDAADQETTVDDIHYAVVSSVDEGFMDVGAKLGSGKIRTPALTELKFELDEAALRFLAAAPACRDTRKTDNQHQAGLHQAGRDRRRRGSRARHAVQGTRHRIAQA